jgi:hypothetical protein
MRGAETMAMAVLVSCMAATDEGSAQSAPPVSPQPLSYAACQIDGGPAFPLSDFGTSELQLRTKSGVKRFTFAGRIVADDQSLIDKLGPVDQATLLLPLSNDPATGKTRCVVARIRTDVPLKPAQFGPPDEFPTYGWELVTKKLIDNALPPNLVHDQIVDIDPKKYAFDAFGKLALRNATPLPGTNYTKFSVIVADGASGKIIKGIIICSPIEWNRGDRFCYIARFIANDVFLSAAVRTIDDGSVIGLKMLEELPRRLAIY